MWIEKRKDHYRMYERYVDPITKKKHKVRKPKLSLTPKTTVFMGFLDFTFHQKHHF